MNWNTLSNEKLLSYYQNGEFKAFDAFYKRNHKIVLCFLIKKLNNQEAAEDILQETFCRIHRHILKYDPSKNAINWILTIAHNTMISSRNKHGHKNEEIEEIDGNRPKTISDIDRLDLQEEINILMKNLDPNDRKILNDRLVEEKSFDEIGKAYGITTVNARQKVSRLVKQLRSVSQKHNAK